MIALVFILFVLQIADAYTTLAILHKGGRELNPVMRIMFDEFGREESLMLKTILVTVAGYFIGLHSVWILAALVVFYAGIIAHNIMELRK